MGILETVNAVLYVVTGTMVLVMIIIVVIAAGVFALAGVISAFVSFVTMLYHYFNWNEL
jgi:hypothetical protein